jgi:hypothetical protein
MASNFCRLTLILAFAFASDVFAAGGIYQWTDVDGVVHFTDDPGKVPKVYRDTVQEIRPPEKPDQPKGAPPAAGSEPESEREAPSNPGPAPKAEPEGRPAAPSESVDQRGHDRDWWQQRVQEWQTRKAQAQEKLTDAQERLGRERFLNPTTGNMKRIQEISDEIARYEEQIREAEHMLTDQLPDEARKAGAPPGWLRE